MIQDATARKKEREARAEALVDPGDEMANADFAEWVLTLDVVANTEVEEEMLEQQWTIDEDDERPIAG